MRQRNQHPGSPRFERFVRFLVCSLGVLLVVTVSAGATSLGPSNAQRQLIAQAEARHLLTLTTLPSGATRLARWTPKLGGGMRRAAAVPSGDIVDLTHWYLAPGG